MIEIKWKFENQPNFEVLAITFQDCLTDSCFVSVDLIQVNDHARFVKFWKERVLDKI